MLAPRFEWDCHNKGCCVFSGGTEKYDIYMGKCHERPWDPQVLLVTWDGLDYEFENVEGFARWLEEVNDRKEVDDEVDDDALGRALAFVLCFFPTPQRWALNEARKEDANTE